MSSLLEVPAQLALVLSLAASTVATDPPSAPVASDGGRPVSQAHFARQPFVGPFRFSEASWLRALKKSGADGRDYARSVFKTSGGRYYVPAATERRQILAARRDVALAGRVAQAFAESNARALSSALGRAPSAGELYIAHLFGPEAAVDFIQGVEANPAAAAAKCVPELAQAAPALFRARDKPVTLAQVYKRLTEPVRRRANAARRAMPRLKPTVIETAPPGAGLASRLKAVAWRVRVSAEGSEGPRQ